MKKKKVLMVSIAVGILIFVLGSVVSRFSLSGLLYSIVFGLIIATFPYLIIDYINSRKIRALELQFPEFLRNLAESVKAGMTLPKAIENAAKTDFGELTPYIKKFHNLLSWGIPLPDAIKVFKKETKESSHIQRGLSIIMEAYYFGGNIAEIMASVADSTNQIINIEKDRTSIMSQQTTVMYIVQFVFIAILIGLFTVLIPLVTTEYGESGISGFLSRENLPSVDYFRILFFLTIVIQSVANGVVAGETQEGRLSAGVKHSGIMLIIGLVSYLIFIYPINYSLNVSLSKNIAYPSESIELIGHFEKEGTNIQGALVNITLANKSIQTITDARGDFKVDLKAPSKIGDYNIVVIIAYDKKSIIQEITLQVR